MSDDTTHRKIRDYISNNLQKKGDTNPFDDTEKLITGGRLDSLDAVEMVVFLEDEFGVDFSTIGFDLDLIDSVNAIIQVSSMKK